jgi:predicted nucleic-acid-binding protein
LTPTSSSVCWPATTAAKSVDAKGIATAVEMLLHHDPVAVQDSDVVAAALAQFRKKPATSFTDCLTIELARKAGHLPLGTFDRDLARLPGAALLR